MDGFWRSMLGEWKAVVAAMSLAGAFILLAVIKTSGPVLLEIANVARFGSYADDLGNHPTVIVRLSDGSTQEIMSTPELLRACTVGATIALVRRARSFQVHPRGCR